MEEQYNINLKGIKFFNSKKYFNVFHQIFFDTKSNKKVFKLFERTITKNNKNYFPLKETNKNGYWFHIYKYINTPVYLDISYKKVDSKNNSEYIINEFSYKYIQQFCRKIINKLKLISITEGKNLYNIKILYIKICAKLCNNKRLNSRNIMKNGKIDYIALSIDNSKLGKLERASLYITEKFTSIICDQKNLLKSKTRTNILEKYNALKNLTNEMNQVINNKEDEKSDKLELKYFLKTGRPIGYITEKFIGPTDEKSLIMKQRKIFISHKLRENVLNHNEEKKNTLNVNSHTTILSNDLKKISLKNFKTFHNGKFNNHKISSLKTCYSFNSFLIGLKKPHLSKNLSSRNIKGKYLNYEILKKNNIRSKSSKSFSRIDKIFFITKRDLFY
jgi:hypothetical protein